MQRNIMLKIQKIENYVSILEKYKVDCKERFSNDEMFEGAVLHYLYVVSDSCISLAEMLIKYKSFGLTQSYFDSISLLGQKGVIPREFAFEFSRIASFRNFLAHDYEKIDALEICEKTLNQLDDIKEYVNYIKKAI
jgi:uncharacterized protein YutE (UPF0331/DUF86 family)